MRINRSLIIPASWSGQALSLGTKVITSNDFRAGFKTLSFSQLALSLLNVDKTPTAFES